jgi:hypothetical protein
MNVHTVVFLGFCIAYPPPNATMFGGDSFTDIIRFVLIGSELAVSPKVFSPAIKTKPVPHSPLALFSRKAAFGPCPYAIMLHRVPVHRRISGSSVAFLWIVGVPELRIGGVNVQLPE